MRSVFTLVIFAFVSTFGLAQGGHSPERSKRSPPAADEKVVEKSLLFGAEKIKAYKIEGPDGNSPTVTIYARNRFTKKTMTFRGIVLTRDGDTVALTLVGSTQKQEFPEPFSLKELESGEPVTQSATISKFGGTATIRATLRFDPEQGELRVVEASGEADHPVLGKDGGATPRNLLARPVPADSYDRVPLKK
jgi:hypothetical protein